MALQEINQHKDYSGKNLCPEEVDKNPLKQFEAWIKEALQNESSDANAMILATADRKAHPSLRTVLLRDFSEKGFVFFTNYNSQKGREIDENPYASVLFFWPVLQRQVRIEGMLEKVDPKISETYFYERPAANQVAAWISPQSSVIDDKSDLLKKYTEFESKYIDKKIPYPEFWGGYILKPVRYEFWQGQLSRLHDRVCYILDDENNEWDIARLAP